MVVLRARVSCLGCKNSVEKTETLLVSTQGYECKYLCKKCYQKKKEEPRKKIKKKFYCERCRYKFKSKREICPYCNQGDRLVEGKVTIHDLL